MATRPPVNSSRRRGCSASKTCGARHRGIRLDIANFGVRASLLKRPLWTCTVGGVGSEGGFKRSRLPDYKNSVLFFRLFPFWNHWIIINNLI